VIEIARSNYSIGIGRRIHFKISHPIGERLGSIIWRVGAHFAARDSKATKGSVDIMHD
jgi:hypothetical protein